MLEERYFTQQDATVIAGLLTTFFVETRFNARNGLPDLDTKLYVSRQKIALRSVEGVKNGIVAERHKKGAP